MISQNDLLSDISAELDTAIHVLNRIADGLSDDGVYVAFFMANYLTGMKARIDAPEEQPLRVVGG